MTFDEKVPLLLREEQEWFGSIIGRPIDFQNHIHSVAPSGRPMEMEAAEHIAPSPTMQPVQRIELYNQQYWWRLLNTLHESFPIVVRLLGHFDFNRLIGFPYLVKYPPTHWSLSFLGDRLVKWCMEDYVLDNKQLILDCLAIDFAFTYGFVCGSLVPLTSVQMAGQEEEIFSKKLYIQPFIFLYDHDYNLFHYRTVLLEQDVDFWRNHELPVLDRSRKYYHVLYRNKYNDLSWKEISYGEYFILSQFQNGASIEHVCELLEEQDPACYEAASEHLQHWFQEWTQREWLSFG
jgi:Putative DNA-binding domain